MIHPRTRNCRGAALVRVVLTIAALGFLLAERHRVLAAIRGFSLLPGSVDRAAAAAAKVRPLLEAELAAMNLKLGDPVFLRVLKEDQVVEVWMKPATGMDYVHYKTYLLCRSPGEPGPPARDGDLQLPEGFYGATLGSLRPHHRYYLAFDIGYPNALDWQQRRPGRTVLVRGDCMGNGSLALNNPNIEELYTLVSAALRAGQEWLPVHLFPFRLSDEKMNELLAANSPWLEFWANLKEGYDFFEIVRRPPTTSVRGGRYDFE